MDKYVVINSTIDSVKLKFTPNETVSLQKISAFFDDLINETNNTDKLITNDSKSNEIEVDLPYSYNALNDLRTYVRSNLIQDDESIILADSILCNEYLIFQIKNKIDEGGIDKSIIKLIIDKHVLPDFLPSIIELTDKKVDDDIRNRRSSTNGLRFCSVYPSIWKECVGINLNDLIKNMYSLELKAITENFNNIHKKQKNIGERIHGPSKPYFIFKSSATKYISKYLEVTTLIYLEACLELSNRSDPIYKKIREHVPKFFSSTTVSYCKSGEKYNPISSYLKKFEINYY